MDEIALGGGLMLFGEGVMLGQGMKFKRGLELGVQFGVACNDLVPFRGEGDGSIGLIWIGAPKYLNMLPYGWVIQI